MERAIPLEKSYFLQVFILGCERHKRSNHNTLVLCPDNMKWKKLPRAHVSYLKISELMPPSRVSLQTNTHAVTCSGHRSELLSRGGQQTHTYTHRRRRTQSHTKPSAAQLSANGIIVVKMVRAHIPPPLRCLAVSCLTMEQQWRAGTFIYLFIFCCAANQPRWSYKGRKQRGPKNPVCIHLSCAKFTRHAQQSGCWHRDGLYRRGHTKIYKKPGICSITCAGWMINK